MTRWLFAVGALIASSVAAGSQDRGDLQLLERPAAHEGLPRTVREMQCFDTSFGDFICYKQVGSAILSVEGKSIDPASPPNFISAFRRLCKSTADLAKPQCEADVSFNSKSSESERLRLETGGPLVRRVKFIAESLTLKSPR